MLLELDVFVSSCHHPLRSHLNTRLVVLVYQSWTRLIKVKLVQNISKPDDDFTHFSCGDVLTFCGGQCKTRMKFGFPANEVGAHIDGEAKATSASVMIICPRRIHICTELKTFAAVEREFNLERVK